MISGCLLQKTEADSRETGPGLLLLSWESPRYSTGWNIVLYAPPYVDCMYMNCIQRYISVLFGKRLTERLVQTVYVWQIYVCVIPILMKALETQRCATVFGLRKRLNELSATRDALEWEKQKVSVQLSWS